MPKKIRIDKFLVEKELCESREQAQKLVMAGFVFADNQKMVKPAQLIKIEAQVEVRGASCPYVSRGGWKLEKALDSFGIGLEAKKCLDLGASTGGFTDLMLQRGAESVAAVDVGKGQLHWRLRQDSRVEIREKTNARYLKPEDFSHKFDFLTGDLSFIGLHLILPAAFPLAADRGEAVFLIKPQFEAGREQVEKGGVVRNPEVHREVLLRVAGQNYGELGFFACGLDASPIKGPAGNVEYLVHYRREKSSDFSLEERVEELTRELAATQKL